MSETKKLEELRGFLMDLKDCIVDMMVQISDGGEGVPTDKAVIRFMDYNLFLLVILHCLEIIDNTDYRVEQMVSEMASEIDEILGGK